MSGKGDETRERIDRAALDEFLHKGFRGASLRTISSKAGVTTGSFYWYYRTKEELFSALVGPHYDHLLEMYRKETDAFWNLDRQQQESHPGDMSRECMVHMLEYMHAYKTEFLILLHGADGTPYSNMLHEMTEHEIISVRRLYQSRSGTEDPPVFLNPQLEHIVVSGMFQGLFELIIHDVPMETARACVHYLHDFYTAGFAYTMNLPLPPRSGDGHT